jgi:mannitol 2-dehydrogenase
VVDRITPATTEDDRAMVRASYGIADACPVVTEPFRQWVLEDRFPLGRPPWEELGVQFTPNVHPYETLKLRCLNGAHSALAYPGALLGYEYIHEIAGDELFRRFLRLLWDLEILPTLDPVPAIDPLEYTVTLVGRFSNPATRDRTSRVCMDGSSKLPTFILPSVRDQLRRGGSIRLLGFVVASWCRYLAGRDERGRTIEIDDPLGARLQGAAKRGPAALLNVDEVFGDDLRREDVFMKELDVAWKLLAAQGTRSTLTGYLRNTEPGHPA